MRPRYREKSIGYSELVDMLLPKLRGNVFHVTSREGFRGIEVSGAILANEDGLLGDSFPQSRGSYFRHQGCVCLFDLRSVLDDEIGHALEAYYFLNPPHVDNNPVFLFLQKRYYDRLRTWSEAGQHGIVVPYVEAGFPGKVCMSMIREVWCVSVVGTRHESWRLMEEVLFAWRKGRFDDLIHD